MTPALTESPTRQKPGPKVDPHRFPCGCARTSENTITQAGRKDACRRCTNERNKVRLRQRREAAKQALTAAPTPRTRLSQSQTYLRLMAEAKAEFARQISASRWKPGRRAS